MTALEFIKLKQKSWAEKYIKKQNKNNEEAIQLVSGSLINGKDSNNNQDYFDKIKYNLFPINDDKNINEYGLKKINNDAYSKGSGNEITDKIKKKENKTIITRAKMKATFSSSAIVVNLFQYWQEKNKISPLLEALGFKNNKAEKKGIVFESKNPIKGIGGYSPHLDVVISTDTNNFAIESKFTEPYNKGSDKNSEIQDSYIKKETLWENLPNLGQLAQAIHNPNNPIEKEEIKELIEKLRKTKHLDASQLIKHILGLKSKHGKKFKLLYLWYDVPGTEGYEHRQEIEAFASIAKADRINFSHITYQEVIFYLKENHYAEHENYIDYLVERYL